MTCKGHYCTEASPSKLFPNWMRSIQNFTSISEITLPGTHDSCCRSTWEFAETQTWTLSEQLQAGIRYLDIRCRHINNVFAIHHDLIFCGIFFSEVLNIITKFLSDNPSETVLMRIKEEYKPEKNTRSFQDTFRYYLETFGSLFYWGNVVPNMGEARGKVVLLRDFYFDKGLSYYVMDIQDKWQVDTLFDLRKKKDAVNSQCVRAVDGDKWRIYANYCSGAGWGCYPYTTAGYTNEIPLKYSGRLGVVIQDFPGEKLIEHLIKQNPGC